MPRIILADDNESNRYYLEKVLTNSGYDVTALKDGKELIEEFEKQRPDLIITDVNMPILNGFAAVEKLRSLKDSSHIPIIIISATYTDMKTKVKGINLGANDYLPSPIDEDELLVKVSSMIKYKQLFEELEKTKEELQNVTNNWQTTFDATNDVIWLLDKENCVLQANKAKQQIFQLSNEELIGKHCWEIVHGTKQPLPDCPILRAKDSLRRESMELKFVESWFEIAVDPILDKNGEYDGAVHIIRDVTERKRVEEALRDSELQYQLLSDATFESIFLSEKGICIGQNKTAEKMFDYSLDEALGRPGTEWIVPEDRDLVKKNMLSGYKSPYEVTAIRKDGSTFPCEIQGRMMDYEDKNIRITALRDITGRKQTEEALRKSEKRFKSIYENATIGIYRTTPEGQILMANPSLVSMLGFSSFEELAQRNLKTEGSEAGYSRSVFQQRIESEGEIVGLESAWKRKDGTTLFIRESSKAIRDEVGNTLYYEGTVEDITERKQAEAALHASQKFLESIVENIPNMIFVKEANDLRYVRYNKAGENLLGYSRDELIGKNDYDFFPKDEADFFTVKDRDVLTTGKMVDIPDETIQTRHKGERILHTKKIPLYDDQGEPQYLLGISEDITERKQTEEEIKRNLKEKTILLSEVHHRVKNSLQVVASLIQLQSRKVKEERIIDLFDQSRNRIYMMASVYEKLYQSKNFASIDFKEYLEDVLENLFRSSGMSQRASLKMNIKNVVLGLDDAIPVALILNELFTNSIKYAFPENKKGAIKISFNLSDEGTYQLIYKDNGIGLPENIDFDTTESLGLHLVKMLAAQIEGTVVLEQNGWTIFRIEFKGYGHAKKKYSHS
jgi:PAS domain S-box-containing protein